MPRITIRYFVTKPGRLGRARYFWQPSAALRAAGWQPVRLSDDRALAMAEAEKRNRELDAWRLAGADVAGVARAVRAYTVAALIRAYKADRRYRDLARDTRRGYDQCLGKIEAWAGDVPVPSLSARHVETWYVAHYARAPSQANHQLTVLRTLLAFAVKPLEWIAANPARDPKMKGASAHGRLWSRAAVDAFVAMADALGRHSMGTAVMLNEWIGQRPTDVPRLLKANIEDGHLTLRQSKTGARVQIQFGLVPHLVARLAEEAERQRAACIAATTLLAAETTGLPYAPGQFRDTFAMIRDKAAAGDARRALAPCPDLAGLTFWFTRHTAVTRLAEAGCTEIEIAAITGHTLATVHQILNRYMVRTAKLASAAIAKRVESETIR